MDNSPGSGDVPHSGISVANSSWGPDRRLRWLTLAIVLVDAVWLALDRNDENRIVAAAVCVFGLVVFAVLTRIRVRLVADGDGLTIRGPLRVERAGWDEVASIATPLRGRFGRRAASLEIEIYDDPLGDAAAGKAAANAGPASADDALRSLRPGSGGPRERWPGSGPLPDTRLVVFGSLELGADPAEVGRALRLIKP